MTELPILLIMGVFLLAGMVKGVVGFGLPTVSLGMLAMIVELPTAMALMLMPTFITNVWQSLVGGNGLFILRKIGVFLFAATVSVWLGTKLLASIDLLWSTVVLGVLLITYASTQLAGLALINPQKKYNAGLPIIAGLINGTFGGLTGAFIFPSMMYLQTVGLKKDQMIQAMGILFILTTIALAIALNGNNLLNIDIGWASVWAVFPAIVGMILGSKIRQYLSEAQFRRVLFIAMLLMGLMIIGIALGKVE